MTQFDQSDAGTDPDSVLLEGLFQLVITGHTDGREFEQLNSEVYQRLHASYDAQGKLANVQMRGTENAEAA